MKKFMVALTKAHKTLVTWYAYLVATNVFAKEYWEDLEKFIPQKYRHGALLVVTIVVLSSEIRNKIEQKKAGE